MLTREYTIFADPLNNGMTLPTAYHIYLPGDNLNNKDYNTYVFLDDVFNKN